MLILRIDAKNSNVSFLAASDRDAVIERYHRRSMNNARHLRKHGIHVVDCQRVGGDISNALRATFVFRENEVRAYRLDLAQHVLLARHADGDYQDQRSCADNHAEGSQRESYFVAAKSIVGEVEDLAECELRSQFRYGLGYGGSDRHAN